MNQDSRWGTILPGLDRFRTASWLNEGNGWTCLKFSPKFTVVTPPCATVALGNRI